MRNIRILQLAHVGALSIWDFTKTKYEEYGGELHKYHMDKAWDELKEIEALLKKEEDEEYDRHAKEMGI